MTLTPFVFSSRPSTKLLAWVMVTWCHARVTFSSMAIWLYTGSSKVLIGSSLRYSPRRLSGRYPMQPSSVTTCAQFSRLSSTTTFPCFEAVVMMGLFTPPRTLTGVSFFTSAAVYASFVLPINTRGYPSSRNTSVRISVCLFVSSRSSQVSSPSSTNSRPPFSPAASVPNFSMDSGRA